MKRRGFFTSLVAWLATVPLTLRASSRPRYVVPPTMWFENEQGERWIPDPNQLNSPDDHPAGFVYMRFQHPRSLREVCYRDNTEIFAGESTWSEDLVLAMATTGDYRLSEAILIAAHLCERCMNAAAHDYGLTWGYPRGSVRWVKCGTSCEHCETSVGQSRSVG